MCTVYRSDESSLAVCENYFKTNKNLSVKYKIPKCPHALDYLKKLETIWQNESVLKCAIFSNFFIFSVEMWTQKTIGMILYVMLRPMIKLKEQDLPILKVNYQSHKKPISKHESNKKKRYVIRDLGRVIISYQLVSDAIVWIHISNIVPTGSLRNRLLKCIGNIWIIPIHKVPIVNKVVMKWFWNILESCIVSSICLSVLIFWKRAWIFQFKTTYEQ